MHLNGWNGDSPRSHAAIGSGLTVALEDLHRTDADELQREIKIMTMTGIKAGNP